MKAKKPTFEKKIRKTTIKVDKSYQTSLTLTKEL